MDKDTPGTARDYKAAWQTIGQCSGRYDSFEATASDRATRTVPTQVLMRMLGLQGAMLLGLRAHGGPNGEVAGLEVQLAAPQGGCLLIIDEVAKVVQPGQDANDVLRSMAIPEHAVAAVKPLDSYQMVGYKLREPVLAIAPCPPGTMNAVLALARADGSLEGDGDATLVVEHGQYMAQLMAEEAKAGANAATDALCVALRARVAAAAAAMDRADEGVDMEAPLGNVVGLGWDQAVRKVGEYLGGQAVVGNYSTTLAAVLGVPGERVQARMRCRLRDGSGRQLVHVVVVGAGTAGWVLAATHSTGDVELLGPAPRNGTGPVAAWEDDGQEGGELARNVYTYMMLLGGLAGPAAAEAWAQETGKVPELRSALAKAAKAAQLAAVPGATPEAVVAAGLPWLAAVGLPAPTDPKRLADLEAAIYTVAVETAEAWAPYRLAGERLRAELRAVDDIATRKAVGTGTVVDFAEAVYMEERTTGKGLAAPDGEANLGETKWLGAGAWAYDRLVGEHAGDVHYTVSTAWAAAAKAAIARVGN